MATLNHITNHSDQAIERLDRSLRNAPKREGAIRAFGDQLQEIEEAFQALATQRTIDGATVGAQLDVLGRIVGEARAGHSDGDYLTLIRARIRRNRSSGNAEELYALFRALVDVLVSTTAAIKLRNEFPAGFTLMIDGPIPAATAALLALILDAATVAGVRPLLQYSVAAPAGTFTWDASGSQAWDTGVWGTTIE